MAISNGARLAIDKMIKGRPLDFENKEGPDEIFTGVGLGELPYPEVISNPLYGLLEEIDRKLMEGRPRLRFPCQS